MHTTMKVKQNENKLVCFYMHRTYMYKTNIKIYWGQIKNRPKHPTFQGHARYSFVQTLLLPQYSLIMQHHVVDFENNN